MNFKQKSGKQSAADFPPRKTEEESRNARQQRRKMARGTARGAGWSLACNKGRERGSPTCYIIAFFCRWYTSADSCALPRPFHGAGSWRRDAPRLVYGRRCRLLFYRAQGRVSGCVTRQGRFPCSSLASLAPGVTFPTGLSRLLGLPAFVSGTIERGTPTMGGACERPLRRVPSSKLRSIELFGKVSS